MKKKLLLVLVACLMLPLTSCKRLSPAERVAKAQEKIQQGKIPEAIIELEQVVNKYPDDPAVYDAYETLAFSYYRSGNLEEARRNLRPLFTRLGVEDQRGRVALENYLTSFIVEKRNEEGRAETLKYLNQLQEGHPLVRPLQLRLAQFLLMDDQLTSAQLLLDDIIAQEQDENVRIACLETLAAYHEQRGEIDPIIDVYKDYLNRYPQSNYSPTVKVGIGFYHIRKGDSEGAEPFFQQAFAEYQQKLETAAEPEKPALLEQLARAHTLKGNSEKAREYYKTIIDKYPGSRQFLTAEVAYGDLLVKEKQYDEAQAWFEQLINLYPNSRLAQEASRRLQAIAQLKMRAELTTPSLRAESGLSTPASP